MKIVIKKHISNKVNQYLLGKWYWHVEHHALRSQGGICFTYKGAERKARKEAERWKYKNAQHSINDCICMLPNKKCSTIRVIEKVLSNGDV